MIEAAAAGDRHLRDEKHIRYLAEHLLHTGIGQLGRRDIHALRRIALRLQAQYDASVPEAGKC